MTVQSVPRETQIERAVLVWVAAAGTLNVAMANTNPATMVTCCALSIVISTNVTRFAHRLVNFGSLRKSQ